jgi:hypothetical protein
MPLLNQVLFKVLPGRQIHLLFCLSRKVLYVDRPPLQLGVSKQNKNFPKLFFILSGHILKVTEPQFRVWISDLPLEQNIRNTCFELYMNKKNSSAMCSSWLCPNNILGDHSTEILALEELTVYSLQSVVRLLSCLLVYWLAVSLIRAGTSLVCSLICLASTILLA